MQCYCISTPSVVLLTEPSIVAEDFDPLSPLMSCNVSYTVWIIGKQNACKMQ